MELPAILSTRSCSEVAFPANIRLVVFHPLYGFLAGFGGGGAYSTARDVNPIMKSSTLKRWLLPSRIRASLSLAFNPFKTSGRKGTCCACSNFRYLSMALFTASSCGFENKESRALSVVSFSSSVDALGINRPCFSLNWMRIFNRWEHSSQSSCPSIAVTAATPSVSAFTDNSTLPSATSGLAEASFISALQWIAGMTANVICFFNKGFHGRTR